MMADINWWHVIPSFIGGSVVATFGKIAFDLWRERKQPVFYKVETNRIFGSHDDTALQANATVEHGGKTYNFSNLTMVKVIVGNGGHTDRNDFSFGITFPKDHRIILCECASADRHHVVKPSIEPSPACETNELDFSCTPFNRRDEYTVKMYVCSLGKPLNSDSVKLSTAMPVRLVTASSKDEYEIRVRVAEMGLKLLAALISICMLPLVFGFVFWIGEWVSPIKPGWPARPKVEEKQKQDGKDKKPNIDNNI